MTISEDKFKAILDEDYGYDETLVGDDILHGLKILEKYIPNKTLIGGADHDIIYSIDVEDIVGAGITESDAIMLGRYGWHISDDYLAHYV